MKKILVLTMTVWVSIGPGSGLAEALLQTSTFYEAASKLRPEGALGQIVGQELIPTPVAGAQAWRIAYTSSDVSGRKTIVTGLVYGLDTVYRHFDHTRVRPPLVFVSVMGRIAGAPLISINADLHRT